jgi:hypothetical protein
MKVLFSWSGNSSRVLAEVLHKWLTLVFPDVTFWISSRDIQAGQRWGNELDRELEATGFGILCLVPTNLLAPWLLFEAGLRHWHWSVLRHESDGCKKHKKESSDFVPCTEQEVHIIQGNDKKGISRLVQKKLNEYRKKDHGNR